MSLPSSLTPLFSTGSSAAAAAYQIQRSLRFNSADSAYLSRTPAVAGNRTKWTWAGWVKRSALGSNSRVLFGTGNAGNDGAAIRFNGSDQLEVYEYLSGSFYYNLVSTQVFRDPSSFGHLVVSVDTSQATSSNRIKIYWNGSQITAFGTSTYPSPDYLGEINTAVVHGIGRGGSYNDLYFSGYLADIHFIDDQQLTPSSFTEVSATTGQLIPKTYSGTFGTNGFWLKFSDNSAATAAALGNDYSGNNNDWTPNNLSVTAGAGNDSLVDTPTSISATDTGVGGEIRGNYATLNPLSSTAMTLSNGNLDCSTGTDNSGASGTVRVSTGKWFFEATTGSSAGSWVGWMDDSYAKDDNDWAFATGRSVYSSGGLNGNGGSYAATYTTNDVIGCALDLDNGTVAFYKNGVSQGTMWTGLTGTNYRPFCARRGYTFNFGQRAFAYPLSGFKALCDTNLPAPVVAKPNTLMDVALYTGNGSTQTISGLNFSPDLVWIKARSAATAHLLFDQIRGATYYLSSNATDAESNIPSTTLTAFTSDGFTLGSNSSANGSSVTLAAWAWDAGTSTVSNTQGSITSQVRANVSAGFSVMTGSTPASNVNFTFGHNLGIAPSLVIYKHTAVSGNWQVYHRSGSGNNYNLNSTAGPANSGTWSGLDPSSTLITIPSGIVSANSSAFVCYAWAPVVGYSSMGSYVASSGLPYVYLGFRPRFVLIKNITSSSTGWRIIDSARDSFNDGAGAYWLSAQSSGAEVDERPVDLLSNGFKLRMTDGGDLNYSSDTYIYYAVAENPFQYSRAR